VVTAGPQERRAMQAMPMIVSERQWQKEREELLLAEKGLS
jgi:hypothetical protein